MSITLILIIAILILSLFLMFNNIKNLYKISSFNDIDIPLNKNIETDHEVDVKPETLDFWNNNNTLESIKLEPCLTNINGNSESGRLTCFSAPAWWYPYDKYNPENFKSETYLERLDPVYNYLGNSQDMFWEFKTVKGT